MSVDEAQIARWADAALAHNRAEAAAGFPLARRVPSTDLVGALIYLEALPAARLDRLFTEWHRLRTRHGHDPGYLFQHGARDPDLAEAHAFMTARASTNPFRRLATMPVKLAARIMRGGMDALHDWQRAAMLPPEALDLRPDLAADYDALVAAKPAKIRKALAAALQVRFGAEVHEALGLRHYVGAVAGVPFRLQAVYAEKGGLPQNQQFDYGLAFGEAARRSGMLPGYEALWQARGCWDYLTEANLEASMGVLGDIIDTLADLYRAGIG
ncbi:MAG: hypothetical protein AAF914_06830 [Pseudomonadota bacterium]